MELISNLDMTGRFSLLLLVIAVFVLGVLLNHVRMKSSNLSEPDKDDLKS